MFTEKTIEIVSQAAVRAFENYGLRDWDLDDEWDDAIIEDEASGDRCIVKVITDGGDRLSLVFEMHDVVERHGYVSPQGVMDEIKLALQNLGIVSPSEGH